jgi:hypothetical protein
MDVLIHPTAFRAKQIDFGGAPREYQPDSLAFPFELRLIDGAGKKIIR